MATPVPDLSGPPEPDAELMALLQEALDAAGDFLGAAVGWIGLTGHDGRLEFPVRRGRFSENWLNFQRDAGAVWGFAVSEGPTLVNNLPAWPLLGEPPLRNLLSCPLLRAGQPCGQIVLADKPNGFTGHDATVLESTAHYLSRLLTRAAARSGPVFPAALLHLALDHIPEGLVVMDDQGGLLYVNATWSRWTGYPAAELCAQPAPLPFWVSHRDLTAAGTPPVLPRATGGLPAKSRLGYLPFRHRTQGLFWCQIESIPERCQGRDVTLNFLRRLPGWAAPAPLSSPPDAAAAVGLVAAPSGSPTLLEGQALSFQTLAAELPFALALTDGCGQVLWANRLFLQQVAGPTVILGQPLRTCFTALSAAALERLTRDPEQYQRQERGHLVLDLRPPATSSGSASQKSPASVVAYWQVVHLPQGPGFAFAFADDWEALWTTGEGERCLGDAGHAALRPEANWLALLLRPGGAVEYWDERWEQLTGLTQQDIAGTAANLLLDWLLPQEKDRNLVADLFHQPSRHSVQAVLEVAGREGRHSLLCTFLPVRGQPRALGLTHPSPADDGSWLVLACEPPVATGEHATIQRFLRQFTRGLSHLLNNYLTAPIGLAEMALDRTDLPPDLAASFQQILDSCMRAGRLIASLQDLALVTPGTLHTVDLAAVVREVLQEQAAEAGEDSTPDYELTLDVRTPNTLVDINPRMLKVVVRHLLTNAQQALLGRQQRRITIQVDATANEVCCAIQDTGEGLAVTDWTATLAPFYSTKGPFARASSHAALDATGLGLTVSQHLLALHGGRLELRSQPGQGTVALLYLPRPALGAAPAGTREQVGTRSTQA
jgi:signal transduction histidine kinase